MPAFATTPVTRARCAPVARKVRFAVAADWSNFHFWSDDRRDWTQVTGCAGRRHPCFRAGPSTISS